MQGFGSFFSFAGARLDPVFDDRVVPALGLELCGAAARVVVRYLGRLGAGAVVLCLFLAFLADLLFGLPQLLLELLRDLGLGGRCLCWLGGAARCRAGGALISPAAATCEGKAEDENRCQPLAVQSPVMVEVNF